MILHAVALYVLMNACTCDTPQRLGYITTAHPHRDCATAAEYEQRVALTCYGRKVITYCKTTGAPLASEAPEPSPLIEEAAR